MLKRTAILLGATAALLVSTTAAFASPASPRWESSAALATWNHGGYLFQNDKWNCAQAACGKQTIWANSANNWGVTATMAAGNTAILTYPDIGKVYNDLPVSRFSRLHDRFRESMPRSINGLSAEAANDVWLNHWNIEMMIWVDQAGRSLYGATRIGRATISGQHFTVWSYGSEFIFDLNHNETAGSTHILSSIDWLIKHGHVPAGATLSQVEFGWEIASTHGQAGSFKMSHYSLSSSIR